MQRRFDVYIKKIINIIYGYDEFHVFLKSVTINEHTTRNEKLTNETNHFHTVQLNITKETRLHTLMTINVSKHSHTQGYLGAMNTCPSDSKLFGSSDSKSATERGRLSGKSSGQSSGELWVNSSCSSEV